MSRRSSPWRSGTTVPSGRPVQGAPNSTTINCSLNWSHCSRARRPPNTQRCRCRDSSDTVAPLRHSTPSRERTTSRGDDGCSVDEMTSRRCLSSWAQPPCSSTPPSSSAPRETPAAAGPEAAARRSTRRSSAADSAAAGVLTAVAASSSPSLSAFIDSVTARRVHCGAFSSAACSASRFRSTDRNCTGGVLQCGTSRVGTVRLGHRNGFASGSGSGLRSSDCGGEPRLGSARARGCGGRARRRGGAAQPRGLQTPRRPADSISLPCGTGQEAALC